MSLKKLLLTCLIGAATLCVGLQSQAYAEYPTKPITILVMANPGGGTDLFARQLAPLLSEELGQAVIVKNQPGGGGNLAANSVVKSRADGYTLGLLDGDVVGLNFVSLNVSYDYEDLIPISFLGGNYFGIYANASSPWNSFADVEKEAKEENRPIKIALFDTKSRYVIDSLSKTTGVKFTVVPSQSAATTLTSVLGDHVEFGVIGTGVGDSIVAGKAKFLGSLGDGRFDVAPNVPTLKEQGYDFMIHTSYLFLYAPKGTPEGAQAKLEQALKKIIPTPEYEAILKKLSFYAPQHDKLGREFAKPMVDAVYKQAMEIKADKDAK